MSAKRKDPDEQDRKCRGRRRKKQRGDDAEERYVPPPTKRRLGVSFGEEHFREAESYVENGLRKVRPYYFDFETYCKGRWVGKSLLEVFSSEFRSEPLEYYKLAAQAGRLKLNKELVTDLNTVLKDNDFLRNTVHRHEPPVTAQPLRIIAESDEIVAVDKPPSLPVHPCGRFRHNTVIFILGKEHNLKDLHTIHRLDRMTSGVLMFAKTLEVSKKMDELVRGRLVEKQYVCRVTGEFPEEMITCEEPILVVSYKIGVCRVDPKGKPCKTVFERLSYNGKTSVVKCFPYTGRTHQIRVHLQYLGHPIVNDPVYNTEAWGTNRGKRGEINKTNEELLQSLIEEHTAKQSLDILDITEEDLPIAMKKKESEGCEQCPVSSEPVSSESDQLGTKTDKDIEASVNVTCDVLTEGPTQDTDGNVSSGVPEESRHDLIDPLCGECKIVRSDPSPKDLVMYLHALRYKGEDFDFSSELPEWAKDDWVEG
ncbi:PREDICTED: RNA pseudouridylate synthase domain-containing protein 2 [Nanorana parkeri]|uniref:RNA pseudouridylate synthase domain-containing protein 2 n=1 Tax=Nanorana parkeri TaxID=125878 RepID=UPI000854699C|nr:PREDICTED: RNA pseudouridylate synthase domain-containing protein 2 [Nanorana parkeri]